MQNIFRSNSSDIKWFQMNTSNNYSSNIFFQNGEPDDDGFIKVREEYFDY